MCTSPAKSAKSGGSGLASREGHESPATATLLAGVLGAGTSSPWSVGPVPVSHQPPCPQAPRPPLGPPLTWCLSAGWLQATALPGIPHPTPCPSRSLSILQAGCKTPSLSLRALHAGLLSPCGNLSTPGQPCVPDGSPLHLCLPLPAAPAGEGYPVLPLRLTLHPWTRRLPFLHIPDRGQSPWLRFGTQPEPSGLSWPSQPPACRHLAVALQPVCTPHDSQ